MRVKSKRLLITLSVVVILLLGLTICAQAVGIPEDHTTIFHGTFWSLLPPIIAIILALITKEVYSSLFVGILIGSIFYAIDGGGFSFEVLLNSILYSDGGIVTNLADSWNMGIMVFLVLLGWMVSMMNRAGGSAAFGRWASKHIKTRVGAQVCTTILGCLIFVDDYFNCLTVGSVMRPITDKHNVSRAKLSYIIDATAAPVCIIAPISSWAAAVTSYVPEEAGINGFLMFIRTIPWNFYALLTICMMLCLAFMKFDFGPMKRYERNAKNGDLFTTPDRPYGDDISEVEDNAGKGSLWDLVLPVVVLIVTCFFGLAYTGGFFEGVNFVDAFASADASVGLALGSMITVIFCFFYFLLRKVLNFKEFMDSFTEGFKAMVPAMLILTFAWSLSSTTKMLGSSSFVADLVSGSAGLQNFLPVILFLIACGISFATGTSWGTFGILIPIVCDVFVHDPTMLTIAIAASLGGAVMGDHCSPISDTTIMASAGGHCLHVDHVATQLPYACTVAVLCAVGYILSAFIKTAWILTPLMLIIEIALMFAIRARVRKKDAAAVK